MTRILLTTTSYQDTPGPHHAMLESAGAEIVRERGPLSEAQMLELAGDFDAFLCGDDEITRAVLEKAAPRLKIVAKYGIGVDKIDVDACTEMGIPVSFCPGVNHTTVAEHTFALMLAVFRNLVTEANYVSQGNWKRLTGHEIMGKTLGVIGLGRIGQEVTKRAKAFGLDVIGYDVYWPEVFASEHGVERAENLDTIFGKSDIITLHTNLSAETAGLVCRDSIAKMKDGVVLLNTARGGLVNEPELIEALKSGKVGGYGADVIEHEPPTSDDPMLSAPNVVLTPHIGSRTYESVQRQACMATENLLLMLKGEAPLAQVNKVAPPAALV